MLLYELAYWHAINNISIIKSYCRLKSNNTYLLPPNTESLTIFDKW